MGWGLGLHPIFIRPDLSGEFESWHTKGKFSSPNSRSSSRRRRQIETPPSIENGTSLLQCREMKPQGLYVSLFIDKISGQIIGRRSIAT